MDWEIIESHDYEFLFAAKVDGGVLVKYEYHAGAIPTVHVSYAPGMTLRVSKKDGSVSIVKGK